LESRWVRTRRFVSKNVCHGVMYDGKMHSEFEKRIASLPDGRHRQSLKLIYKGMESYLKKKPEGKAFHDPLAACCVINPHIGHWEKVNLYREKGEWGSARAPSQHNAEIIVGYNHQDFLDTLLAR
jgi:inosine-uridine nucleoside N-ribohydrolase